MFFALWSAAVRIPGKQKQLKSDRGGHFWSTRSCTLTACFQKPLLYQRGLLWAERAVIKEVKHAFKTSVLLLFNTNDTFQWLKAEAGGGKKEAEVKEGRQGEKNQAAVES